MEFKFISSFVVILVVVGMDHVVEAGFPKDHYVICNVYCVGTEEVFDHKSVLECIALVDVCGLDDWRGGLHLHRRLHPGLRHQRQNL
ncbi:unnamed protein product, partial [Iphiclides podalirius]